MVNKNFDKKWDTLEMLHTIGIYLNKGCNAYWIFYPSKGALIRGQHLFECNIYLKVTCNKELSHVNGIITFSVKLTE